MGEVYDSGGIFYDSKSGSQPSPFLPSELAEHSWAAVAVYCKQHGNRARNQHAML